MDQNPYSISVIQRCIFKQGYCKYESLAKVIIIYTVHFGLEKFVHDLEHNFCHPMRISGWADSKLEHFCVWGKFSSKSSSILTFEIFHKKFDSEEKVQFRKFLNI